MIERRRATIRMRSRASLMASRRLRDRGRWWRGGWIFVSKRFGSTERKRRLFLRLVANSGLRRNLANCAPMTRKLRLSAWWHACE
jgi:hypothetical protein